MKENELSETASERSAEVGATSVRGFLASRVLAYWRRTSKEAVASYRLDSRIQERLHAGSLLVKLVSSDVRKSGKALHLCHVLEAACRPAWQHHEEIR
jgi:hypothetical protein